MIIYFGLELDDKIERPFISQQEEQEGVLFAGPNKVLKHLEALLGEVSHSSEIEHLRAEQYRQVLIKQLEATSKTAPFYAQSFQVDQLATAISLLQLRDELKLERYDFISTENTPARLSTFCALESISNEILELGFSDRWLKASSNILNCSHSISTIKIVEPRSLLPVYLQNWLNDMAANGVEVYSLKQEAAKNDSDLDLFKKSLTDLHFPKGANLKKDGSLIILKAKRETELARFIAQLVDKNDSLRPSCLIPDKNRALDNAFIQESLPSFGILSASLGRPTLQILKLVTAFLWQPIDPIKIMEFVSLAIKPIEDGLATVIAKELARTPGIGGDNWSRAIAIYFEQMREKASTDASINLGQINFDYEFWFKRTRYNVSGKVPKNEVRQIFDHLRNWALKYFDESSAKNNSILVLSEQANRMLDLLDTIPEKDLSYLELERIVRSIYEPAPVQFSETQVGYLPFAYQNTALLNQADQVLWWNFSEKEPDYFFARWYKNEIDYLYHKNVRLSLPKDLNEKMTWQRQRPVFCTKKQLILAYAENVNGNKVLPHPLMGNLKASFANLEEIIVDIEQIKDDNFLTKYYMIPDKSSILPASAERNSPFIDLMSPHSLAPREKESYSSLDDLFYYPYKWVFKHQLALYKSSILSVVKERTLLGNLAHRFFELLLKEDIYVMSKVDIHHWIDQNKQRIFSQEGALLLLYGKEPERINFIRRVKYAATALVQHICDNKWKIIGTEVSLNGNFLDIPVKGIADLVLERGNETAVVDLKWSGRTRRISAIKSEEDLQLILYAKLIGSQDKWAHTSYFVLDSGVMIARNNLAFSKAYQVSPDQDHQEIYQRIWSSMEKTFKWRFHQLASGKIEIRTAATSEALEEHYGEELLDVLEMKSKDAPFDDYVTLVNRFD